MNKNYIIAGHKVKNKMNKTEEAFYEKFIRPGLITKEILYCYYEKIKLEIGLKTCWYMPDFIVIKKNFQIVIYEVKGPHIYDDARIKFKVACKQYPRFKWECWQLKNKMWTKIMEN